MLIALPLTTSNGSTAAYGLSQSSPSTRAAAPASHIAPPNCYTPAWSRVQCLVPPHRLASLRVVPHIRAPEPCRDPRVPVPQDPFAGEIWAPVFCPCATRGRMQRPGEELPRRGSPPSHPESSFARGVPGACARFPVPHRTRPAGHGVSGHHVAQSSQEESADRLPSWIGAVRDRLARGLPLSPCRRSFSLINPPHNCQIASLKGRPAAPVASPKSPNRMPHADGSEEF